MFFANTIARTSLLIVMLLGSIAQQAVAAAGLANPAAEHCIENGGLFGIRDGENGQFGVCLLDDGQEVDAWEFFRSSLPTGLATHGPQAVNPAAAYCISIGGAYRMQSSRCTLADGTEVDAWEALRAAHAQASSIANPAATYCLEIGGAYEIRQTNGGQMGLCTLTDGTEINAWDLFRQNN